MGMRVEVDDRNEKIGYKIREAQVQKIPYMVIIGDKDIENDTVSIRHRKDGDLGSMSLNEFKDMMREEIDMAFCGDLLNQCVASSFAMSGFGIPYLGIYGACSTMALGLMLSAVAVESGAALRAICAASSHYCTAERQYRMPLEYGSQRPPTAQWTVTGSGACVVEADSEKAKERFRSADGSGDNRRAVFPNTRMPYIRAARPGIITDLAVTDQNNMGAAMAPANVKQEQSF